LDDLEGVLGEASPCTLLKQRQVFECTGFQVFLGRFEYLDLFPVSGFFPLFLKYLHAIEVIQNPVYCGIAAKIVP